MYVDREIRAARFRAVREIGALQTTEEFRRWRARHAAVMRWARTTAEERKAFIERINGRS